MATWNIGELVERARVALSVDYDGPDNKQVRAVPDARTIRYYATLGLVDKPAAMRGRTALYERRHLEQVVAIKRLQAQGLSLAEVQERLAGASRKAVSRLAQVPRVALTPSREAEGAPDARTGAATARRSAEFWKAVPSESAAPATPSSPRPTPRKTQQSKPVGITMVAQLELAPGLTLSFEPGRNIDANDLERVRAAAEQLVQVMTEDGLIRPDAAGNAQ